MKCRAGSGPSTQERNDGIARKVNKKDRRKE